MSFILIFCLISTSTNHLLLVEHLVKSEMKCLVPTFAVSFKINFKSLSLKLFRNSKNKIWFIVSFFFFFFRFYLRLTMELSTWKIVITVHLVSGCRATDPHDRFDIRVGQLAGCGLEVWCKPSITDTHRSGALSYFKLLQWVLIKMCVLEQR